MNFATHEACTGLGIIGTNQTQARTRGLHLHSTLAVSGEGLTLGVLRAPFAAPEPRTPGAPKAPRQERKSFQWSEGLRDCAAAARDLPDTRVISVMDREADFLELFDAQRQAPRVELLVRARHNRRTRDEARQSARAKHSQTPARA